ncbi:LamG-like jellyroll fold domain-containing protein [Candidatus Latescibacterota bacterium]
MVISFRSILSKCTFLFISLFCFLYMFNVISAAADSHETGLLFYLSGDNGLTADYASGEPTTLSTSNIGFISDGAKGTGLRCPHESNTLAYCAPGNVYAERGTLAFFFRFRDPPGETPFKIFQVSHNDHSSFDMQFLRIDYNGAGFDAFVTDINLARARVSYNPSVLPGADDWIHMALTWDETVGIRFYIDGERAAARDTTTVLYAGLGIFGAHGYMMNNLSVGPGGPDIRGSDFDEIRIYDRMLSDSDIKRLSGGSGMSNLEPVKRDLDEKIYRDEWWLRYGWNLPVKSGGSDAIPPCLEASSTGVRKVEIHDAYDLKQWIWKGNDGIRETTWPNVYNRSRLPGRTDYFILPDWNCYSTSGKSITFTMPEEQWNYIEMTGAAFGTADLIMYDNEASATGELHLFDRPEHQERTFHRFEKEYTSGKIRFTNTLPESPIGEFNAYRITPGGKPENTKRLTYSVTGNTEPDNPEIHDLISYIHGRFLPDERAVVVALPSGAPRNRRTSTLSETLPLVHILIPFEFRNVRDNGRISRYSYTWENINGGLDGFEIELPALDVQPTHGEYFPLNIQVKDPLWPDRNLIDFSFSVKPHEARTLWLDTRDRILPNGESLYITVAGAGGDFSAASLEGMRIHLVFKDREESVAEHVIDRFTQIRDNYGNQIEARPNSKYMGLYRRFNRDITDLLRIAPNHIPGQYYQSYTNPEQGWPTFQQPEPNDNVPLWAFRQIECLKLVSNVILWWIDNRQIENGELGGGLSDDSDFTNVWPIPAMNGVEPEKITDSLHRVMEAIYDNGMMTDGINTIQADGLHVTEEGNNVQGQLMILEYGDPILMERMMESVRGFERITGINEAGHRHVKSGYFGAGKISQDEPWLTSRYQTSRMFHPAMYVAEFSGHPRAKKLMLELSDGLLAHRKQANNGRWYTPGNINFKTDGDSGTSFGNYNHVFWGAWQWTHNKKYLQPFLDSGIGSFGGLNANVFDVLGNLDTWGKQIAASATPHSGSSFARFVAWQVTGNKQYLEELYADEIQYYSQHMYLNTEGHIWTDRVRVSAAELQRSRLGGVVKRGKGNIYPGQTVSWKFKKPATYEDVAFLMPDSAPDEFTVIAYNLRKTPVSALMIGWMVDPGEWEIVQGIDSNGDDNIDTVTDKRRVTFERTKSIELVFEPRVQTIVKFRLRKKGIPYWKRPDLGICLQDIKTRGNTITVTVHSLGSVHSPENVLALCDDSGKALATAVIPPLEAPIDLMPRRVQVTLDIPSGTSMKGCSVCIDPDEDKTEITRMNNMVEF